MVFNLVCLCHCSVHYWGLPEPPLTTYNYPPYTRSMQTGSLTYLCQAACTVMASGVIGCRDCRGNGGQVTVRRMRDDCLGQDDCLAGLLLYYQSSMVSASKLLMSTLTHGLPFLGSLGRQSSCLRQSSLMWCAVTRPPFPPQCRQPITHSSHCLISALF